MPVSKEIYQKLLKNNEEWVKERLNTNTNYFTDLEKGQSPHFLWIGCADSRVPAEEITGLEPGDVFVHRNIANVVSTNDFNLMSVLQYAVEVLHVQHIIVCGHYGCGGVIASMSNKDFGLVNKWLHNIKEVYFTHHKELDAMENEEERGRRLVELNVQEQVRNLAETSIVQKAWHNRELSIHGWVFDMGTGFIKDLDVMLDDQESLHPIFRYDLK